MEYQQYSPSPVSGLTSEDVHKLRLTLLDPTQESLLVYAPLPDEAIQHIQDRWRDNAPDSSGQSHPQAKADIMDLLKERDHYKASSRQWESLARSNELDQKDSPNPTVFALEFEPPPATRRQMWDVMAQRWVNIAD